MEVLTENPPTLINPYEVLEIETTATAGDIKSAYKKLALRHHPGASQGLLTLVLQLTFHQTRHSRTLATQLMSSSKKLHSHTPYSQMIGEESAMIPQAIPKSH